MMRYKQTKVTSFEEFVTFLSESVCQRRVSRFLANDGVDGHLQLAGHSPPGSTDTRCNVVGAYYVAARQYTELSNIYSNKGVLWA